MAPKYLTGDATAINEFLDKFDVRYFLISTTTTTTTTISSSISYSSR